MKLGFLKNLSKSTNKWIVLALMAMGLACLYNMLIKAVSSLMPASMFLSGLFALQVPFLAAFILLNNKYVNGPKFSIPPFKSLILCLFLGVFGASGNIFEVWAVEAAPNIGYVSAVKLGQIFIITLFGDLVSGQRNTRLIDFVLSLGVILGILLVTLGGVSDLESIAQQNINWVWYSVGAMFSFSAMILGTKYVTRTINSSLVTFWLIFSTAIYLIGFGYKDFMQLVVARDFYSYFLVGLSAVCIGTFNLLLAQSVAKAPNPGFPISLTSLQVPVLTLCAVIFFKDQSISVLAIIGSLVAMYSSFKLATSERKG
jgi:drug/metabolite transporter (DMT)-like permease